jgi:dihydrofolate reductase
VGGASVAQQLLRAGKLDEIQVSVVPLLLGAGVRMFDHLGGDPIALEQTRVIESEASPTCATASSPNAPEREVGGDQDVAGGRLQRVRSREIR